MENSTPDNRIVTAGPPVPEHIAQRLLVDRATVIQRQLPSLSWEWCVKLAILESLPRDTPKRSLMAQASAELRSERAYSESNGGWRYGVNKAAARRIP